MLFEFYRETSAKNGDNVDEVFNEIVKKISDKLLVQTPLQSQKISENLSQKLSKQTLGKKNKNSCC